jgi:hypothetical protein
MQHGYGCDYYHNFKKTKMIIFAMNNYSIYSGRIKKKSFTYSYKSKINNHIFIGELSLLDK